MTKITVMHRCHTWLPQTATWLYNQVRYLPETRILNHIVCETTENLDQFPRPHIHALADYPVRYLWQRVWRKLGWRNHLAFAVDVAKSYHVNLVHSHFGYTGWSDLEVVRRTGAKHVVTFYGFDVTRLPQEEPIWQARYQELFAHVDAVLCEGPYMRQSIIALGCPAEKAHVHHLGVQIDDLEFRPRVWRPGQKLRVLIAASFIEKKGIPDALTALGRIQNDVDLEITIIGDAPTGARYRAEKEKILQTLETYQLIERTRLLGYQSHEVLLNEAYQHHIFISPSFTASDGNTEGGAPVSLIEMSATGMPIVSTTHCDIPAVVINGRSGLLAPERDIDTLVAHLRWLIAHPDRWVEMADYGRAHVEKEYSASIQGERLADIYTALLALT